MTTKRLIKGNDRCISAVCSGIADFFGLDPTLVRIGYAAITIFTGCIPGVLLYIVMACVIPEN